MSDVVVLVIFALVGVFMVVALSWSSADARLRRRRRKAHSRIQSTANRPMVKFSVKTRKKT